MDEKVRQRQALFELREKTLGQILDETVARIPDKEAIVYADRNYRQTWREFADTVDLFAKGLMALGVQKGEKVAVWASNVPYWVTLQFATAKIGAILITVNTNYREHELEYLLNQSECENIFIMDSLRDHDYIDIGRRNDMGTLLIGNAETMREIERLSGCQIRFDARPNLDLSGIGKQVLDNGGTLASLFDFKKRLTGNPTVGNGLLPCFSAFTLSHNHIETVITQVKALSRALYAITDYRDHLIFEDFSCFFQWKFFTGNYIFVNSAKINYCHFVFVF